MLGDGDAVFFNAEAVHSYERVGDESCTALILTMPEALLGNHSGSKLALGKKKLGRGVPPRFHFLEVTPLFCWVWRVM
jgi:hypothetical protein